LEESPVTEPEAELSPELKRSFRLILTVIVTVVSLLGLEVGVYGLESAGLLRPRSLPEHQLNYVPSVYTRFQLERSSRQVELSDGRRFPINAHGMRGPETTLAKPDGLTRIMIYGGSHVFDLNRSDTSDWPREVERLLGQAGLEKVEVLNAGTPGNGSADAVGHLLTEGHHFQPDLVVLDVAWNDLKSFSSNEPLLQQVKPFFGSYRSQYRNGLDRILCRSSRLYLAGRSLVISLSQRLRRGSSVTGPEGQISEAETRSSVGDNGRRQVELNLRAFVSVARSVGATPVLVTQPTLVRCDNTAAERERIQSEYVHMTHELLCAEYAAIHGIVRAVGDETGTPVIDAVTQVEATTANFSDHVHATAAGSQKIARVIASGLAAILNQPNKPAAADEAEPATAAAELAPE
jgi:lysophospholipase L1-like esterase